MHHQGHLYFAYGSNLSVDQMLRRCPGARVVGHATLRDWQLQFAGRSSTWGGGVATVERHDDGWVEGVVWRLSPACLRRLDACEGHPRVYRRRPMRVHHDDGTNVVAYVYVRRPSQLAAPSTDYLSTIWNAYRQWGLDEAPLAAAVRRTRTKPARSKTMKRTKVFVYGSLMRGLSNNGCLSDARYLKAARTAYGFALHSLGAFPAAVRREGAGRVEGELYEVDEQTLARLDRLEGHPTFYRRQWIRLHDGEAAQAYLVDDDSRASGQVARSPLVPSGNWRDEHDAEFVRCALP